MLLLPQQRFRPTAVNNGTSSLDQLRDASDPLPKNVQVSTLWRNHIGTPQVDAELVVRKPNHPVDSDAVGGGWGADATVDRAYADGVAQVPGGV